MRLLAAAMWCSTLLASVIFAGMAVAPDLYSPEYLYTSDNSPVQFGPLYEMKRYLKRENPPQLSRYLRELDEYAKGIQLGTHRGPQEREREYNLCSRIGISSLSAIWWEAASAHI